MQRELRELKLLNTELAEKAMQSDNLERKVRELNYEIRDIQHQETTNRVKNEELQRALQI
jgi:hypothetical protein